MRAIEASVAVTVSLGMGEYRLKNESEVYAVICAALAELNRADTPYSYGAALNRETNEQIIYFDLPRVSPLQFNVSTKGIATREELVTKIKTVIAKRMMVG